MLFDFGKKMSAASKYVYTKNKPIPVIGGLILIPCCILPLTFVFSAMFKPHIFDAQQAQYMAFSGYSSAALLMFNAPNNFGVRIFSSANVFMGAAFTLLAYRKYLSELEAKDSEKESVEGKETKKIDEK